MAEGSSTVTFAVLVIPVRVYCRLTDVAAAYTPDSETRFMRVAVAMTMAHLGQCH